MRSSKRPFHPVTTVGLFLLVIANVGGYVLSRHTTLSEHTVDPLSGLLHGLAIGVLLLGIIKQSRALRDVPR
jgi:hypothetical protein